MEYEDRHLYYLFESDSIDKIDIFSYYVLSFFDTYDYDILNQRLRFFKMNFEGDCKKIVFDVFRDLDNPFAYSIPLFAVSHTDNANEKNHVHVYYIIDGDVQLSKKELKKIPHVEKLINTVYESDEEKYKK